MGERVLGRRAGAVRLAKAASNCALALIKALAPPSLGLGAGAVVGGAGVGERGRRCPFRPSFLSALSSLHARLCSEQESLALSLGLGATVQGSGAVQGSVSAGAGGAGGAGGGQVVEGYPYDQDDIVLSRADVVRSIAIWIESSWSPSPFSPHRPSHPSALTNSNVNDEDEDVEMSPSELFAFSSLLSDLCLPKPYADDDEVGDHQGERMAGSPPTDEEREKEREARWKELLCALIGSCKNQVVKAVNYSMVGTESRMLRASVVSAAANLSSPPLMHAPLTLEIARALLKPFEFATPTELPAVANDPPGVANDQPRPPSTADAAPPQPSSTAPPLPASEEARRILEILTPLSSIPGFKYSLLSLGAIRTLLSMHKVLAERVEKTEGGGGDGGIAIVMIIDLLGNLLNPDIDLRSNSTDDATAPDDMQIDAVQIGSGLLVGPAFMQDLVFISSELKLAQVAVADFGGDEKDFGGDEKFGILFKCAESLKILAANIKKVAPTAVKGPEGPLISISLDDLRLKFESVPPSSSSSSSNPPSLIKSLVHDPHITSFWDYCKKMDISRTTVLARKLTRIEASVVDKSPGLGIAASELFGGEGMTRRRRPRDGGRLPASIASAKVIKHTALFLRCYPSEFFSLYALRLPQLSQ